MGVHASAIRRIRVRAQNDLVENSAAVMSIAQPGVLFTINDAGNEPLLFAVDTTGAERGVWRVARASNVDWEAAALGPCGSPAARSTTSAASVGSRHCIYIGDTGDNLEKLPLRAIYRVAEPTAEGKGRSGTIASERLVYRYEDGPHDVEAMYVAPNGDTKLITKRRRRDAGGRSRPALVFTLPASAWGADSVVVARLTDSLPIVPGSAQLRTITDASLSADARYLAVRTYGQVYVFAVDSATARARSGVPPTICNIARVQGPSGEGITWVGATRTLLLTAEGKRAPMEIVRCPLPDVAPPAPRR